MVWPQNLSYCNSLERHSTEGQPLLMIMLVWISEPVDFGAIMPRTLSSMSIFLIQMHHRTRQPQPPLATVDMKKPNKI